LTVKSSHYTKVPKHLNKFSYRKCHWQLFRYQWFNFFKIDEEEVKISAMTDTVNILIVDERLDDIQTLCSALEDPNWNIISALSGVEALKIVQNEEFAVAILDAKILSSGGYKIAKEIHRTEKNKSLPIISVTSLHHQQGMFEGYESGAVDYLFKPIPSIIIRSKVKTFVQLKLQNKLLQQANEEAHKANQELEEKIGIHKKFEHILENAYKKIKEQQNLMLTALEQAKETQKCLLPEKLPDISRISLAYKFDPMEKIGGDFFNFFELEDNKLGIMIADVAGHGLSAAMISFMISGVFANSTKAGASTKVVMNLANSYLQGRLQAGRYATMFYGILDLDSLKLTYTTAGHPPGLIVREETEEVFSLKTKGTIIGMIPNKEALFGENEFQFVPGDKLILYTDGILESKNEEGQIYGMKNFTELLGVHKSLNIEDLLGKVHSFVQNYSCQNCFNDDITLVGLEIDS